MTTIVYKGRFYRAYVYEQPSGETTATIKIGRNSVLLVYRRTGNGTGEWVREGA